MSPQPIEQKKKAQVKKQRKLISAIDFALMDGNKPTLFYRIINEGERGGAEGGSQMGVTTKRFNQKSPFSLSCSGVSGFLLPFLSHSVGTLYVGCPVKGGGGDRAGYTTVK